MSVTDPDLINQLANQYVNNAPDAQIINVPAKDTEITPPPDTTVELLGGLPLPTGEFITTVEIRELTGRDEEAISKANTLGKVHQVILERGVVKVGDQKATTKLLDQLLAGDRDWVLLHIYAATFGPTVTYEMVCPHCSTDIKAEIDMIKDVETKKLANVSDRQFTVDCKVGKVTCVLPTGVTQRELYAAQTKTAAEMSTILLSNCVTEINGFPIMGPAQVLDLGIADRRKIAEEIAERVPGPQLRDITVPCASCGEALEAPITFDALFRF